VVYFFAIPLTIAAFISTGHTDAHGKSFGYRSLRWLFQLSRIS
jgi:hypothetical protein